MLCKSFAERLVALDRLRANHITTRKLHRRIGAFNLAEILHKVFASDATPNTTEQRKIQTGNYPQNENGYQDVSVASRIGFSQPPVRLRRRQLRSGR